jgi:hypothetical protein
MLKRENQVDKKRFRDLKSAEETEGMTEEEATQKAAEEVKEIRKQEGRTKDPSSTPQAHPRG